MDTDFPLIPVYVQDVVRDYAASHDVLINLEKSITSIVKKHERSTAKGDCHIWEVTLIVKPGVTLKVEVLRDSDGSFFEAKLTDTNA